MYGWKAILATFAVTLSVGIMIGMLLLINSTKKVDKSQQEIRQEKVAQAQSERKRESRSKASSTTVEVPENDVVEEVAPKPSNVGEYAIVDDPIDYTDAPGPQAPGWYFECEAKKHHTQYIERIQTDKSTDERPVYCGSFICHTDRFYQDYENLFYMSPEREAYLSSLQESYRQSNSE